MSGPRVSCWQLFHTLDRHVDSISSDGSGVLRTYLLPRPWFDIKGRSTGRLPGINTLRISIQEA